MKQIWYADDATGAGTCNDLRVFLGQSTGTWCCYGYHPNATKTHLVVKAEHAEKARELFAGTGINSTTEGKQHLGAAIGSRSYTGEYVAGKVRKWSEEIKQLANIAKTQPHAAYCAYTHGLSSCWTFLSRIIPDIADLLQPLEGGNSATFDSSINWPPTMLKGGEGSVWLSRSYWAVWESSTQYLGHNTSLRLP